MPLERLLLFSIRCLNVPWGSKSYDETEQLVYPAYWSFVLLRLKDRKGSIPTAYSC